MVLAINKCTTLLFSFSLPATVYLATSNQPWILAEVWWHRNSTHTDAYWSSSGEYQQHLSWPTLNSGARQCGISGVCHDRTTVLSFKSFFGGCALRTSCNCLNYESIKHTCKHSHARIHTHAQTHARHAHKHIQDLSPRDVKKNKCLQTEPEVLAQR